GEEGRDAVVRPADLEGEDWRQVFALEKYGMTESFTEVRRAVERRRFGQHVGDARVQRALQQVDGHYPSSISRRASLSPLLTGATRGSVRMCSMSPPIAWRYVARSTSPRKSSTRRKTPAVCTTSQRQ